MWRIIFALPNITLGKPVGNENIAIVPHNDERIQNITSKSSYSNSLVNGFENQFKKKVYPSLLIVNSDAPAYIEEADTVIGFRNIFALSVIVKGYEYSLTGRIVYPKYSDFFDFYPITISKNDDGYFIRSPSQFSIADGPDYFRGQSSPSLYLPKYKDITWEPDERLFGLLEKNWDRRFLKKKKEWKTRALFRSLEMAYQASTMPYKNYMTIYDFGVSVSMWVSAFEILSHPPKKKASLSTVLKLLGQYDWSTGEIKKKRYKINKNSNRVNLVQKCYKELYDARNDFLHGNKVNRNRLHPFKNKQIPHLTSFAPLLYKVALLAFLEKPVNKKKEDLASLLRISLKDLDLCEAILKLKPERSELRGSKKK